MYQSTRQVTEGKIGGIDMFRNVLLPVDGSSFSEHAIPYASAIARRARARIHVVLVHTPLAHYAAEFAPTPLVEQWEKEFREKEARYVDGLVESLRKRGLDAVAENLEGEVARCLIQRSKSEADLLVMATHGRGGLERAWLGSVADEVIHHVRLPVLLVEPRRDALPPDDPSFEHILVATDGSRAAAAATDEALKVARLFDARLTLLRVVSVPAGLSSPYIPHAALMDRETTKKRCEEAETFLAELAEELATETRVGTRVELAYHPAHGILDTLAELDCDLVVVGTHRKSRLARIVLGSVADKVLRASPMPVLIGLAVAEWEADRAELEP